MNLNDADNMIAQWRDKRALIEENLRSFVQLPAFERLAAGNVQTADAETRQKVSAAMDVFQGLRVQQEVLSQTIERAKSLRDSLPRIMPSKQTLQEIDHLLNGNSIQMASSPTPPQRRELLRNIEQAQWISLARLLEIMLDSFRFVRDTVLAINEAVVNQQREATEGLAAAKAMLKQLRELHDRATQLLAERTLKIDGVRNSPVFPSSAEELAALATWLAKLQSAVEKSEYGIAATGLAKWTIAATEVLASNQQSADADQEMLRERSELRGLFDSLVAKATNIGRAENQDLATLSEEIRQLLARRPTPMQLLRDLVARYQQSLV